MNPFGGKIDHMNKKCLVCGNEYFIKKSHAHLRKHCSRVCGGIAKRGIPGPWTGKKRNHMVGEKNWLWKGDGAGYVAIHNWERRQLGSPQKCEWCGIDEKKRYEWANKDHTYKRDVKDWIRLCHMCHRLYDYIHKPINLLHPKNLNKIKLGAC